MCCYFLKIIGQYDESLQRALIDNKAKKEQLAKSYESLLSSMENLLTRALDSSPALAERSFDSNRRDFQKFLEVAKANYSSWEKLAGSSKADKDVLLNNFRTLVLGWSKVFEECSVDPIRNPKRILRDEELQECPNIGSVCDLVLARLRCTEVLSIKIQQEKDKHLLNRYRRELRRLTSTVVDPNTLESGNSGSSFNSNGSNGSNGNSFSNQRRERNSASFLSRNEVGLCGFRWGVLSRAHARLIFAFAFGSLVTALEVKRNFQGPGLHISALRMLLELIIVQICIAVLLSRFAEFDKVQRSDKEIKELRKIQEETTQQQEKMNEFWNVVDQLSDVWLYRTMPRMSLYKQVFVLLKDASERNDKRMITWMETGNRRLAFLDSNIGELSDWCNEGSLKSVAKKAFGKEISRLCNEESFEKLTDGLDQAIQVIKPEASDSFKC
jgi:hypothetical protein